MVEVIIKANDTHIITGNCESIRAPGKIKGEKPVSKVQQEIPIA